MTTQYAVLPARSGRTLTAKLFTLAAPDTVAFTADSVTERTNAKGEYLCTFGEASAISGDHKLVLFYGSLAAAIGFVTFAGTDTETATETPPTVELDSAVGTQINKIEAAVAGTVTGAGTSTEVFVGPSATLTITVDSSGNRSNVSVT